jgi:hypothetical protein
MTKGILTMAAVTAVLFSITPASAKGMKCTEANMAKGNDMMMKMPDGENKTMGMKEMTMAQDSMGMKKMGDCSMHMSKAMKMGMMKSKM